MSIKAVVLVSLVLLLACGCANRDCPLPEVDIPADYLADVWGARSDSVFVVGGKGLALHFNGRKWKDISADTEDTFFCVTGTTEYNAYAGTYRARAFQFNGAYWTEMYPAKADSPVMHCAARDGVVYFGTAGGELITYEEPRWTSTQQLGEYRSVESLHVSGSTLYAVRWRGGVYRLGQEGWESLTPGYPERLGGLWVAEDTIYVTTSEGIFRVAGERLEPVLILDEGGLADLWGTGDTVYGVGSDGQIVKTNGTEHEIMPTPTTAFLNAIWGFAHDDIYAVGEKGTILHYDGQAWSLVPWPRGNRDESASGGGR